MNEDEVQRLKTELADDTKRYKRGEDLRKAASDAAKPKALALLKAGVGPSEVTRLSPFTDAYIRKMAREAGIPPARESGFARPKVDPSVG